MPFYMLAKELYPGTFKPTPAHFFIRLLEQKGLLLRCFTQNIDSLEREAGVSSHKIVAAHGNFDGKQPCLRFLICSGVTEVCPSQDDPRCSLQGLIALIAMQTWRPKM